MRHDNTNLANQCVSSDATHHLDSQDMIVLCLRSGESQIIGPDKALSFGCFLCSSCTSHSRFGVSGQRIRVRQSIMVSSESVVASRTYVHTLYNLFCRSRTRRSLLYLTRLTIPDRRSWSSKSRYITSTHLQPLHHGSIAAIVRLLAFLEPKQQVSSPRPFNNHLARCPLLYDRSCLRHHRMSPLQMPAPTQERTSFERVQHT
jgi:hypothetical protein